KTGLHNILEPAAFGLPTIFGNRTDKFPEAKIFVDKGIGFQISDSLSFEKALNFVKDKNMKSEVLDFMNSQTGATEIILQKT
ncbi:MAG: 3-deoxy-D-manno-octulosonic-acid transferase, partial [Arenicella sp.]